MNKKPNILVFMTDQQNADTIKPWHQAKTPNVDAFLNNAVHFEHAYTASPHCCPARATFFSGLYPSEHGVWNNVEVDNTLSRGLYDNIELFPETLKKNGYNNYFAGKWHVSAYDGPEDRGFDVVLREYISNYGRMEKDNKPHSNDWDKVYHNKNGIKLDNSKEFGEIIRKGYPKYKQFGTDENPFGDTTSVELSCEVIQNYDAKEPFFMYVGATGPHDPYTPPQEFLDMYKDVEIELPKSFTDEMLDKPALYRRTKEQFALTKEEHIESVRRYLAFVTYEDYLFGKLVTTLKEKGIYDDTYIMYVTDHGDYLGAHGLWAKGLPCFREAYNITAAIGGGGVQGKKTVSEFVTLADFAPTILNLAQVECLPCSGESLVPFLGEEKPSNWRTEVFTQTNGNEIYGIQRAVWNKKWKYVLNTFDYDELYDLESDPEEIYNLAKNKENEPIIKEMCKKLWQFAKDTGDNCTCPYIMVSLAPYGPGILLED